MTHLVTTGSDPSLIVYFYFRAYSILNLRNSISLAIFFSFIPSFSFHINQSHGLEGNLKVTVIQYIVSD